MQAQMECIWKNAQLDMEQVKKKMNKLLIHYKL